VADNPWCDCSEGAVL